MRGPERGPEGGPKRGPKGRVHVLSTPPAPFVRRAHTLYCSGLNHIVKQYNNTGPEQSMKIDDRKINRSIDDNRLITVD